MKKTILLLFILCVALLSSCAGKTDEPFFSMTDTATGTEAPEESTVPDGMEESDGGNGTEDAPDVSVDETDTKEPEESGTEADSETDTFADTGADLFPPSETSDMDSEGSEEPKDDPLPPNPEELLAAIKTQNRVSEWFEDMSNVLVHLITSDENGTCGDQIWYYALSENGLVIDAETLDTNGEVSSAHTVHGGAYYGMAGKELSFCVLPDPEVNFLVQSFGFEFFPSALVPHAVSEENETYRLVAYVTVNAKECVEYTYTVGKDVHALESLEMKYLVSDEAVSQQTVTVTRADETYVPKMLAYNAHLNAEDAIRVHAQIKPQSAGETRLYTVSAASQIGAYSSSDGTPFALYKNARCTKNITDLFFGGGSDVFIYVSEWEGEISLDFQLTEDDLELFRAAVSDFESLAIDGRAPAKIIEAYSAVGEIFEYIDSQTVVAYVRYYSDLSNPHYQEDYMLAQSVSSDARAILKAAYASIYASDSPIRTLLFASWSDEELAALNADNSAIATLEQENAALLTAYHALDRGSFAWGDEVNRIYESFVSNNNAIAVLAGYENYYEYASQSEYHRDYGKEERTAFRAYVKEYVVPLYADALERFYEAYAALSMSQLEWVKALALDPYDAHRVTERYINEYIDSFTPSLAKKMSAMFEKDVIVLGTEENAYAGAFTTYLSLYEEPIAYFGPGCTDLLTVIHENGHYAAFYHLGSSQIPGLDLCETHSQGNEWLFVSYLKDKLDPAVYEVLMLERLLNGLNVIIYATVVDECEELIYTAKTPYTAEEYDALINSVISAYGEYVINNFSNLGTYFKLVALNSPVYYLSYATSEMASMALYLVAEEDFEAAIKAYTVLVDEVTGEDRFLLSLEGVGLPTPFKEDTFIMLTEIFGVYLGVGEEEERLVAA